MNGDKLIPREERNLEINSVEDALNILWASKIADFQVDLAKHEIRLETRTGKDTYHVRIGGVVGFAWANSCISGEEIRQDTDLWDYAELTSASIEDGCRVDVTSRKSVQGYDYYLDGYYFKPNLAFEIWSSVLLAEAKTIKVNDKSFTLNG